MLHLKKTLPYLHRPFQFPPPAPLSSSTSLRSPPSLSFSYSHRLKPLVSSAAMSTSTPISTIEHIVLYKINPTVPQSKIDAMLSNLVSLTSLNFTTFLTASPILRLRSAAANQFSFTHILHSRYPSKSNLSTYATHPDHVAVVQNLVLPIVDDVMAIDWVSDADLALPPPGSVVRVTFAKAKEGVNVPDVVNAIGEVKMPTAEQVSFGENFSPGRAKGYGVGMVSVFKSVEEIDALNNEMVENEKAKVRGLIDDVIVLDYVVPNANGGSASCH